MAKITDVLGDVLLAAKGVPEPLAVSRFVLATRQFCMDTRVWQVEPAISGPGPSDYSLASPITDTEVFDILALRFDSRELRPRPASDKVDDDGSSKIPRFYRIRPPGQLELMPSPGADATGSFEYVLAAITPVRTAQTIEDAFLDRYYEILVAGTLARLLSTPGQPWTDYDGAKFQWSFFLDSVDEWRARAVDDGMARVARRVRYGGL